ncbi:armadillo repeat-containing protein gudu [Cylas formicarius]|uniref:armadillo repeat-containing protein gudu n=1 Tax=Cylas formicarius TaxID=197179 RepID=UPI002958C047|nr:armadillo repeat-containing protein gudu [Cylas formicarius]XP_060529219.1 armadillo repeat-containing protein gudu [Cylas formicarius]XP_060529220.1 armadillo repeat-containing protein gudu [Cylas formicarius]XP_060529221.1 armadillo repeat-containing protein gudu [Cylas formicarius]XP_060529222.1 armadillo repeat-containing protein gudu [Cylas formicarius]XP_060529224.1 armadillo repeat-containing protein gudu [Cylas formicarius]
MNPRESGESLDNFAQDAGKYIPREVVIEEPTDSEGSSVSGLSSDDEGHVERPKTDIPPEYWHIQKLVKYLKTGNQTATVVALCCLKDHDLTTEINQLAIQEIGGLELLINLLETKDLKCKLGALSVLAELSQNQDIRRSIANLGGVDLLVKNLKEPARDLQILVAETIYNVAQVRKARKQIRKCDGIPKLVDFLDIDEQYLKTPKEQLSKDEVEQVNIVQAAVKALWSASKSKKNIQVMMKSGSVPLLARLLRSVHMEVVVPTMGTISQCANDPNYQLAIQTEGMIRDIVTHLYAGEFPDLRRYCADTIFKCCEKTATRDIVRQSGGLDPLVNMASDSNTKEDKKLLAAVTGAIWKTAISPENVERFDQLKTVEVLVKLLENVEENEEVLSNVVGALGECLKFEHNRAALRRAEGIPHLVNLLNYTYSPLLENVPMVLRECAEDPESMRIIEQLDGVRLIWSLLKNDSPRVQANAAWSLVPCIRHATDSGEMVRCFVGGLELIVNLLKSPNSHVLACVCAAISEVAKDIENLAVITDHGVVPMLVNLVETEDVELRQHLASAVAYCCAWGSNCKEFGRLGAITPLVQYMADGDAGVHRTTALALFHLSSNPFNCITMHESGVVPFLLKAVSSTDWKLQEAAAGCLANIRKLALEAETCHLIRPEGSDNGND